MNRRLSYSGSMKLDLDSIAVNFFPVDIMESESVLRRNEAIQILAHVIQLASKRGQAKKSGYEDFNEAA